MTEHTRSLKSLVYQLVEVVEPDKLTGKEARAVETLMLLVWRLEREERASE
jgi:hypothetical protein